MLRRIGVALLAFLYRLTVLPAVVAFFLAPVVAGVAVAVGLNVAWGSLPWALLLAPVAVGLALTALWWLPRIRQRSAPAWLENALALALGRRS
ncbi:hypothetical protein [Pararhodospirillum oryzae]|uniref:Uncharacterized protein n=1 Tax=Pararhodospirillum oryzae TaxID=478448 RepID=A0A512H6Y5_9PROT|nr:hypothetical protein [Pararhodospirillum oryzae]GEO81188.1 hypothetical protein ROR02_13190 [Pararhodospirillum oryzae]